MFEINKGERIAAIATLITASLALSKGLTGYFCHSSALFADALHSGSDVFSVSASWLGLRLGAGLRSRGMGRRYQMGRLAAIGKGGAMGKVLDSLNLIKTEPEKKLFSVSTERIFQCPNIPGRKRGNRNYANL